MPHPSPSSNTGSDRANDLPVLRLWAMRQTGPNPHVSVQCLRPRGEREVAGPDVRPRSVATHASSCSRNFGHRPASASHVSSRRLPAAAPASGRCR